MLLDSLQHIIYGKTMLYIKGRTFDSVLPTVLFSISVDDGDIIFAIKRSWSDRILKRFIFGSAKKTLIQSLKGKNKDNHFYFYCKL